MMAATELKRETISRGYFRSINYRIWHPIEYERSGKRECQGDELCLEFIAALGRVKGREQTKEKSERMEKKLKARCDEKVLRIELLFINIK
jgi:hypothetical protein